MIDGAVKRDIVDVVIEWVCRREETSKEPGGPVGLHHLSDTTGSGSKEGGLWVEGIIEERDWEEDGERWVCC